MQTIIGVIAESTDEFLDYINVYKLDNKNVFQIINNDGIDILDGYTKNPIELHITRFAMVTDERKVLFMDGLLKLCQCKKIESVIEVEPNIFIRNTNGFVELSTL